MPAPSGPPTVVVVPAHPDDEAIVTGLTLRPRHRPLVARSAAAVADAALTDYDGREWLTRRAGCDVLETVLADPSDLPLPQPERTLHHAHR